MSEEKAAEWVPTYPRIRRIDDLWCRAERVAAGVMFLAMGLMVFASVIPEVFGRRREWIDVVALFVLSLLAVYTRRLDEGQKRPPLYLGVAIAAVLTAAGAGLVILYVNEFPGGFIWAQKVAMVLMIWVAMFGASVATWDRSHLSLEMGEKLWPERVLPAIKAGAHGITTAFCLIAFYVSVKIVAQQHAEGDAISAAAEWLPWWVAFLVMPYAFAVMTVRFLAQAVTAATKTSAPVEERLPS